jgi:hypothetical protein
VFQREFQWLAKLTRNKIDMEFIDRKLHNDIPALQSTIQTKIDNIDPSQYDAILLGFGWCGKAIETVKPGKIPLVIPRVQDCVTLLFGSRDEYKKQVALNPSTAYYSISSLDKSDLPIGFGVYGPENVKYLMSLEETQPASSVAGVTTGKKSDRAVFIHHNITDSDPYRKKMVGIKQKSGFTAYEELTGDLAYLFNLIEGYWDEPVFLMMEQGETVIPAKDDCVITKTKP